MALPSLGRDLGISAGHLPWVLTSYSLVYGSLLLLAGRCADLFGRRLVFMLGLAAFAGASIVGALAPAPWPLIAARVVQGAGAAAFASTGLALVTGLFEEGGDRNRAIGVFAAAGAMGFAVGAMVGGVLTEALSWRAVIVTPAVIALPIVSLSPTALEESRASDGVPALDVPGAALLTVGIASLLYGLAGSGENGWASVVTLAPIAIGAALLTAFVALEARLEAPLVPLSTFRLPAVAAITGGLFLYSGSAASTYVFAVHLQDVLGRAPADAALLYLPLPLAGALLAPVAGGLVTRLGGPARTAVFGVAVTIAGWVVAATQISSAGSVALMVGGGVAVVVGRVFGIVAMTVSLTTAMGERRSGLAAGLVTTAMELGLATTLAGLGGVVSAAAGGPATGEALATGLRTGALLVVVLLAGALVSALAVARPPGVQREPARIR